MFNFKLVEPKKWEWHSIWFQRKCIRVSRRFRYHTHYPGLSVHTGRHIISYQFQWKIFWTGHQWRSPANTDSGIWPKPLYQRSLEGERLFLFHFSRIKLHVFQSRWVSQGPPLYGSAYGWADIQKVQLLWSYHLAEWNLQPVLWWQWNQRQSNGHSKRNIRIGAGVS